MSRLSIPGCTIAAALAALAVVGCARTAPPGGGPADTTPPFVESTTPADGDTLVDPGTAVQIDFSEEMDRVSVERAFSVSPPVLFGRTDWRGKSFVARPSESLPDSTTFIVVINETARDYHGVAVEGPFSILFSTGRTIDTGVISGTVVSSNAPVAGATVWACVSPPAPNGLGQITPCHYQARTTPDGTFRITNVRASATPYTLFAFVDLNGDGVCSVDGEPGSVGEQPALIDEEGTEASGLVIELPGVQAPEEVENPTAEPLPPPEGSTPGSEATDAPDESRVVVPGDTTATSPKEE
jgi:hypothetical protein